MLVFNWFFSNEKLCQLRKLLQQSLVYLNPVLYIQAIEGGQKISYIGRAKKILGTLFVKMRSYFDLKFKQGLTQLCLYIFQILATTCLAFNYILTNPIFGHKSLNKKINKFRFCEKVFWRLLHFENFASVHLQSKFRKISL